MILHTFNSPAAWQRFRFMVAADDQVLFLEDGVYVAVGDDTPAASAIEDDIAARGITPGPNVAPVSYDRFVVLCTEADKVCSWS